MFQRAAPTAIALLFALSALSVVANPVEREVLYIGTPIRIKAKSSHAITVSLPSDIRRIDIPVSAEQLTASPPSGRFLNSTTFMPGEMNAPVAVTMLTAADKTYAVELVPVENRPDTHIKILDTPKPEPVAEPAYQAVPEHIQQQFRRASTSPLENGIMAMWYTQLLADPLKAVYGVTMKPMNQITWQSATETIRVIWAYQGYAGVYGFTQLVTNTSREPLLLDVRGKKDPYGNLHSMGIHRRGVQATLVPGESVRLHLTYIGEEAR